MKELEQYGIFQEKKRNYENILYVCALVHNSIEKSFFDYFASHGTSGAKYNILMAVTYVNEGKGLNQRELGKHLITSAGNVTKLVESLQQEGLVTRVQNKQNRRENIVKITKKGVDFIEQLWPEYDKMASDFAALIPKSKQKILISILKNWFLKIEKTKKD